MGIIQIVINREPVGPKLVALIIDNRGHMNMFYICDIKFDSFFKSIRSTENILNLALFLNLVKHSFF